MASGRGGSLFLLSWDAMDWSWDLLQAKQMLYRWSTPPSPSTCACSSTTMRIATEPYSSYITLWLLHKHLWNNMRGCFPFTLDSLDMTYYDKAMNKVFCFLIRFEKMFYLIIHFKMTFWLFFISICLFNYQLNGAGGSGGWEGLCRPSIELSFFFTCFSQLRLQFDLTMEIYLH